jgi:hypothetical protein
MRPIVASLFVPLCFCLAGPAAAAPHPYHDDGGAVNWQPNLAAAMKAAQASGKPLFVEGGREA